MKFKEFIQEGTYNFFNLRKNRVPLTKQERDMIFATGAIIPRGPGGRPTPGIWKTTDSKGKIKYCCHDSDGVNVHDSLIDAINCYCSKK